ncbi:MAG: hypothetical protein RL846_08325 [Deltaproteobacteria bacterium]
MRSDIVDVVTSAHVKSNWHLKPVPHCPSRPSHSTQKKRLLWQTLLSAAHSLSSLHDVTC